jgi:hypothetical protein
MATRQTIPGTSIEMYYGKDGMRYQTMEAAEASDKVYNAQLSGAGGGSGGGTVKSLQKKGSSPSGSSSNMTKEFLAQWGNMNTRSLDILSGILSGDNSPPAEYMDLMSDIKGQISSFDEQYGGMTQRAFDASMQDIETQRGLVTDLTQMSQPDYAGVSGRAAADVAAQSELARGDMALEAMSYGVDPTSGKFGELTRKSHLREAGDKVRAMNEARRAEKERSTGLKIAALQNIDPSVSAGIASNLMGQKSNLYGLQTNVLGAMSAAEKAKSDTAIQVAKSIGDIGSQYGSAGLTMLGIEEGKNQSTPGSSVDYNTIFSKPTPYSGESISLNSSASNATPSGGGVPTSGFSSIDADMAARNARLDPNYGKSAAFIKATGG